MAADWFRRPELNAADSPWKSGALYNLARRLEAEGNFDAAIKLLEKTRRPADWQQAAGTRAKIAAETCGKGRSEQVTLCAGPRPLMPVRFSSTLAGPLAAAAVFFAMQQAAATREQSWAAAIATLCACWWVFEALPLSATALVPLVAFR